jgi:uncharacterized membrane protein (UPF0127 family)
MRAEFVVSVFFLLGATCQRVEEPAPAARAPAPEERDPVRREPQPAPRPSSTPQAAPLAPASHDAGPCIAPLADPPPERAEPAASCPADPVASPPVLERGRLRFPAAPGAPSVDIEVARTPAALKRGLMYRRRLGADSGVLFAFGDTKMRTFWMKNTCIPLDMLFLASDGTIAGIIEQVPVLNEAPRAVPCPAAYVLEVNAGYTRRHRIEPGMKAEIEL